MTEEWRPVVGAKGFYEASNEGRIRSLDRVDNGGKRQKGRILKGDARAGQRGYRVVKICAPDGSRRMRYIHDLVLEAFVGPRPRGLYGLHWDDDVDNNALPNLRWGTQRENMEDAMRNGTHPNLRLDGRCSRGHELASWNIVQQKKHPNYRRCLACHYARSYATHRGLEFDPEIADQRYVAARDASDRVDIVRDLRLV